MHCNQIYCYRNTRKKSCSVGTIEEEKARESCGCSAATGRAKWIILHTHTGRVRHGLVGVGGKRLSIFGVTGKTPPLHPHLWLPFQFFLLFFFFFFYWNITLESAALWTSYPRRRLLQNVKCQRECWPVFVGRRQMSGCVARAAIAAVAATSQLAARHPAATSPPAAGTEKAAVACHLQLSSIICPDQANNLEPNAPLH